MPTETVHLAAPLHHTLSGAGRATRRQVIEAVTLRDPTTADLLLLDAPAAPIERVASLVGALTGLTDAQVRKLSVPDFYSIAERALRAVSAPPEVRGLMGDLVPPSPALARVVPPN